MSLLYDAPSFARLWGSKLADNSVQSYAQCTNHVAPALGSIPFHVYLRKFNEAQKHISKNKFILLGLAEGAVLSATGWTHRHKTFVCLGGLLMQ